MKKLFTLLAIATLPFAMYAQSLSPQVFSATGGFSSNAGGSVSYTVGEMSLVNTLVSNSSILTQGFHQPNDLTVGLISVTKDEFGSFVVYPNPAVDNLFFGFQFPEEGHVTATVYDAIGQKVAEVYNGGYKNGKVVETLNVTSYSAGVYVMSVQFMGEKSNRSYITGKQFQVIN